MKKNRLSVIIGAVVILAISIGLAGCGGNMPYDGLDFDKYIKVGEYKGLSVEDYSVEVSDKEVQERIEQALKDATSDTKELKKGDEIKDGDTVNIDYKGMLNGKAFDGGTAEGYDLEIGSNSFIEGFESGLIGKEIGEETELELTFPENYKSEDLAGKDVVFEVKINSGKRPQKPEYNEKFVKNNTSYNSTDEYEKSLKEAIRKEKEEAGKNQQKTQLWSQVMENTEVKEYPEEILNKYVDSFNKQIDSAVEQSGMDRKDFIAQYYGVSDEKTLKKMIKEDAQTRVKQDMAIAYIADKEGIEYTKKDKKKMISDMEDSGYGKETLETQTGWTMDELVHVNLMTDKVINFILENAK